MKLATTGARLAIPQSRVGRRPMTVATLLKRDAAGTLFKEPGAAPKTASHLGSEQASVAYLAGELPAAAGSPALPKKHLGDGPSREGAPATARTESKGEVQQTQLADPFVPASGAEPVGKTAGRLQPLGDQRRPGEGPTAAALSQDEGTQGVLRIPNTALVLTSPPADALSAKIGGAAGNQVDIQAAGKFVHNPTEQQAKLAAALHACLTLLGEGKTASLVTPEQAQQSAQHLQELDRTKPSAAQLQRGALVGALVGPVAASMSKTIGGTWKPRANVVGNLRELAASSASGAVFGGLMPAVRQRIEHKAEEGTLRRYQSQQGV